MKNFTVLPSRHWASSELTAFQGELWNTRNWETVNNLQKKNPKFTSVALQGHSNSRYFPSHKKKCVLNKQTREISFFAKPTTWHGSASVFEKTKKIPSTPLKLQIVFRCCQRSSDELGGGRNREKKVKVESRQSRHWVNIRQLKSSIRTLHYLLLLCCFCFLLLLSIPTPEEHKRREQASSKLWSGHGETKTNRKITWMCREEKSGKIFLHSNFPSSKMPRTYTQSLQLRRQHRYIREQQQIFLSLFFSWRCT